MYVSTSGFIEHSYLDKGNCKSDMFLCCLNYM
jgi:hypothetical protein